MKLLTILAAMSEEPAERQKIVRIDKVNNY